jgi:hypothetical protein
MLSDLNFEISTDSTFSFFDSTHFCGGFVSAQPNSVTTAKTHNAFFI